MRALPPYPRWWIEGAARRRSELDAAVAHLRRFVADTSALAGALVYGSYATNRVGPMSDLDVMLVTWEKLGEDWPADWARLRAELGYDAPWDVVVYDVEQFERLKRERNFVAQAWREGLWIGAAAPA